MPEAKLMFVVVLRADKTLSGLAYRLLATAKHFYDTREKGKVFIVSTVSLWEKCFPGQDVDSRYIKLMNDRKLYKPKALFLWLRCLWYILVNNIRILHTNGNYLLMPVHYLKKYFRYKTVVTFGSANIEMASGGSAEIARQWRAVINVASAVDVLNPVNTIDGFKSDKFVSRCSFPYNLSELEKYTTQQEKQHIITFIGSFTPQKNPLLAIDGFELFLKSADLPYKMSLHLIGKGILGEEIAKRAAAINSNYGKGIVLLHQNDIDLLAILQKSRIFLSLQNHTNYPSQSLMEAMLLGNDVIATDFGDTSLMVLPENNNILIDKTDPRLVCEGIKKIIAQPLRFNKANADFIRKNHRIDLFADYLCNLYSALLREKK